MMAIVISNENALQVELKSQLMDNTAMMNALRQAYERMFARVWNNPNFTPVEIVDAYGTDAVTLFTASEMIKALLVLTMNEDGTVTVVMP
jgi:hypothetical protein